MEVLHNGIDVNELTRYRLRPKDPDAPFRVGMVGRVTRWKGQHVFIEAARRIAHDIPGVEFHLAGDAPPTDSSYLHALVETVKDAELENRVIFHGNVKEIYDFMSGMNLLVHCSVEPEPLGRVILEAMALAKPTIATRGGAVEEICTDGHDALVVDPERPDQLAEAIERLHREPATAETLGRNALRTIETRFSLDRAAHRVRTFYEEVTLARRRRSMLGAIKEFLAGSPLSISREKPAPVPRKID
jgi:glycosyltransferase involved in cell wall biosynthesis